MHCLIKVHSMKFKTETRNYYSLLFDIVYKYRNEI